MAENKWKGTLEVSILGETYTLRPTFDAACEFEEKVGMSVGEAYQQLSDGKLSMKIVCGAIWAGIKGEAYASNQPNKEVSYRIIGEKIMQSGVGGVSTDALRFLTYCLIPDEAILEIAKKAGEEDTTTGKPEDQQATA